MNKAITVVFWFLVLIVSQYAWGDSPSAPTGLIDVDATDSSILLEWNDLDGEIGYEVYHVTKSKLGDVYTKIGTTVKNITTFNVTYIKSDIVPIFLPLSEYTTYRFAVAGVYIGDLLSPYSSVISAATTHTWDGGLQECANIALSNGDLSHVPTKAELESITIFHCENRNLTEMEPIQDLKNLIILNLFYNSISGPIPVWIGNLVNLQTLYLGNNELSGTIPAEIGDLVNLKSLRLNFNQLNGIIPSELGNNLVNLRNLHIGGNQLSGSIPPTIGGLTLLEYLNLGTNKLNGTIPPEIGNLSNLQYLTLGFNQLVGAIPAEIYYLYNLNYISLNHNQLSGRIPFDILNLNTLRDSDGLGLHNNCHLTSDDQLVKNFIDMKASNSGGYQFILDTNGNCPFSFPILNYILH